MDTIYYTYAWLRVDGTPYYIGKGHGKRAWSFRRKGPNRPKDDTRVLILKQNLCESSAFKHEIYMISVFGRKDLGTGILHNRTNGGEGLSGFVYSDEQRKVKSEQFKAQGFSEKHRKSLSLAQTGEKNHRFGKCGEESASYGRRHTAESLDVMSKKKQGDKNPAHGRKWWVNVETGETCFEKENPGFGWKRGRK
jgi:hypothetical protein